MPGYSGTPLVTKLGIKAGFQIHVVNAPDDYRNLIEPLPEDLKMASRLSGAADLVHILAVRKKELTEDTVRELALPLGFVDIKVRRHRSLVRVNARGPQRASVTCRALKALAGYFEGSLIFKVAKKWR